MAKPFAGEGTEDRNYIMLSDDWEAQYWSEKLGTTPKELGRLIDKYGNSAAKIRKILAMAENKRKTEDDIARESNPEAEAGQDKLTPQQKEQLPKSGEFDGHVA